MAGFSLLARKKKNGKPIYYVRFKNPDGTYGTAKSTGLTSRWMAEKWAEDELLQNGVPIPGRDITFGEFSKEFFSWTGPWATNKKVEGRRIGERHCKDRTDLMRVHVLPVFENYKLKEIDKILIRNYRNDLYNKGYSVSFKLIKCMAFRYSG